MKVGDKYIWTPSAWLGEVSATPKGGKQVIPRKLTGRIININRAHCHFTVEAKVNGASIRETIKFIPEYGKGVRNENL